MKKKILSLFLAVVMCFTMVPTAVFAAEPEPCDHMLTAENISEIPDDFWDTHSHDDYAPGTDAIISITQPETCEDDGWTMKRANGAGYCMLCQEMIGDKEIIPAKEHNFENGAVIQDAACTTGTVVECVNSYDVIEWNHYYDAEVTEVKCHETTELNDALGHTWGEWTETKAPTCDKDGTETRVCSVCKEEESRAVDATGHTLKDIAAVAPTCTAQGNTDGQVCTVCGYTTVEVIPALGHDMQVVDHQDATCEIDGFTKSACQREGCNYEEIETIDKLGHDVSLDQWTTVQYPNCIKDGYQTGVCNRCDKTVINVLPATGHTFEITETVEATCENAGYKLYTCHNVDENTGEACGETYKEILPALGHDWSDEMIVVDPTCTEDGEQYYPCSRCDGKKDYEVLPALGHDMGEWIVTLEPSCTDAGEQRRDCTRCDYFETEAIAATGHNVKITKTVDPTCTKDGYNVWTCQNEANGVHCTYSFIEPLDALGHLIPDEGYAAPANCVHGNLYTCARCGEAIDDGARNYNVTFWGDIQAADAIDVEPENIPEGADLYVVNGTYNDTFGIDYGKDENGQLLTGHQYTMEFHAARCEFDAYYVFVCTNDGCPDSAETENHVFVVAIANTAIGHNWALRDDNTNMDPSCTEDGTRHWVCLNDHNHVYTEKLPATGHNFVLIDTVDATCTEGGYNLYQCQNVTNDTDLDSEANTLCGAEYKEYITAPIAHNYKVTDTVAATCTAEGYEVYTCSMCGDHYNKVTTPATGHSYQVTDTVAATCTTEGYDVYTCANCDATYNVTTTPANGHSYKVVASVAATCTTEGYDVYQCENCDATHNVTTTPATGHAFVADAFTDATCTEAGYTTYTCQNAGCDASYNGDFISAKGHNYVKEIVAPTCAAEGYTKYVCATCDNVRTEADGAVYKTDITKPVAHVLNTVRTVAPTCGKDGEKISECINCDYVQNEVIPATGNHQYSDSVQTAATCGKDGVMNHICAVCGYHYETVIPATGDHTYDEKVTKNPTCAEVGEMTYTCSVCGYAYTEELAKTADHQYSDSVQTAATCGKDGVMNHICAVCGDAYTTVIPALTHNYTYVEKSATCTENGVMTATCLNCGDKQEYVIPATGHIYDSEGVYTPPTCVEDGYTTYTCTVCGKASVTKMEGKALGHVYKAQVTSPSKVNKNGTITTTCIHCGKSSQTAIPAIKTIKLAQTKYQYSGSAYRPKVTVKDSQGNTIAAKNYTVSYSSNKNIGTAKVTIKFKGNYSGTVTKTFNIVPKNVGISEVTSKKKQIKFTWGRVKNCSGYQVQYSTSKSFKSAKTVTIKNQKTCSATLKKLKSGKKYYIRVRAYKTVNGKKIYGNWSTTSKTCK